MRYGVGPRFFNNVALVTRILLLLAGLGSPFHSALAENNMRIMAFGDSLTAGFGLAPGDSFPSQLQRALEALNLPVQVLNAGVSGDTTSGGLARLDWALSDRPDMLIVALGANDALRGIDPAISRANLAAILEKLREKNLPVLLAGAYAPPNLGREYEAAFNSIFPDLAQAYEVPLYPFFLEGVATDPSLNQEDGIHPNAEGVAAIVKQITPYVVNLIESNKVSK